MTQETTKNLGIWMDHSHAQIIDFTQDSNETKTIASSFTHDVKEQSMSKGEHLAHNKEQHQQSDFYKKIGAVIKNYDHVLLFGPTDAKQELFNALSTDHNFEKIKIEVKSADKMTENQQHAFVKDYFSKH